MRETDLYIPTYMKQLCKYIIGESMLVYHILEERKEKTDNSNNYHWMESLGNGK